MNAMVGKARSGRGTDSEPGPRLLVIEDDPDVRENLRCGLAEAGYEVRTASTGLGGLRLARQQLPDLVLLDLMLPDVGGKIVCNQLKSDDVTSATRVDHRIGEGRGD